ncbi:triacylglycerol lipase [Aquabacterium lacunae]|uniref:Triacylglycerol lipase n=1 Tax=Aquabacterium lacunae TaxID=2528630 RepID=A0A4Q9GZM7_9BURK|nr:triacylglycerol lipase [Aquabacterium lacunae]TBO31500.1 triacylglycerol lipase [Aquabacterium lacunae]
MTRSPLMLTAPLLALAVLAPQAQATDTGGYARTRYPIVLAHGMAGFDQMGPVQYWHGIPDDLRKHGADVHVTAVSAFNSSEVRGEQLLRQVEQIRALTGAKKVHLIGHSHGSQSSRYVAAVRPDWVASVTAVSGPNKGSDVADLIQQTSDTAGPQFTTVLSSVVNGVGKLEAILSGHPELPQNSLGGLASLNSAGAADFNRRFPAAVPASDCGEGAPVVQGIRYYSWTGIGQFYNPLNPFDYAMTLTGLAFKGKPNDGLVGQCSAHLGRVLRNNYPMNHFHTVNQLAGLVGWGAAPVATYRTHANRLKLLGL